ncbi:MAG TPA: response regulator transcription factor [Polyangiaceae bacterium]|jgi:DNA-binding response OmpR family regulator|nr:response regulator transcription factor [Polyangiaceae bacterium]
MYESIDREVVLAGADTKFLRSLAARFATKHLTVRVYGSGSEVLASAAQGLGAVIVEQALPDMAGVELCRRLRAGECFSPILVLAEADVPVDAVLAYEAGADDYFAKSLDAVVVEAKLQRALQRAAEQVAHDAETSRRTAALPSGVEVRELTRFEERLLLALWATPGNVVSTESIATELWGRQGGEARGLYEHVSTLRAKLRPAGWTVTNVRGKGYRLDELSRSARPEREAQ